MPDFVWTGGLRPTDNPFNSDNFSIAPRFGFAYTLDAAGDFVMRGGYGINFQGYDAQTFEDRLGRSAKIPNNRPISSVEAAAWAGSSRSIRKTCCCISLLCPNTVVGALIDPELEAGVCDELHAGIPESIHVHADAGYVICRHPRHEISDGPHVQPGGPSYRNSARTLRWVRELHGQ